MCTLHKEIQAQKLGDELKYNRGNLKTYINYFTIDRVQIM